jgi:hypothetical protein
MLTGGATDGELAGTLDQVRQRLADAGTAGNPTPPAIDVMISDFTRYHVAKAVMAGHRVGRPRRPQCGVLERFARTGSSERRTRRVLGSFGALSVVSPVVIVVAVANTTTAADPTPALLALFDGRVR